MSRLRHKFGPAVLIALAIVYVVWGSTYYAIRVAIDTMPPLLMAGSRFLIAGLAMYGYSWFRGRHGGSPPTRVQWRSASIIGVLLLGVGNGGVTLSEQVIPSGIAALLVATVPLWLVIFAQLFAGERLGRVGLVGVALGFAGVAMLLRPGASGAAPVGWMAATLISPMCWAAGSLYARRAALPKRAWLANGMEMTAGGAALIVVGVLSGELGRLHLAAISGASLLAWVYLVGFGSILAFSAYTFLLRATTTSVVATYGYVNPLVAVSLGWLLLHEPVTATTVVAGLVIVAAVAMIVSASHPRREPAPDKSLAGLPSEAA